MTNLLNKSLHKMFLIFDLDGTIIDTDEANFLSYKEAIYKVKRIDLNLLYCKNERFTREKLKLLIPNLTNEEFKSIIKIKNDIYYKYLPDTKLNFTVLDIIKKFSKTNKIILATNSHKIRADLLLKYYNLFNIFDKKYYRENYKNNSNKYQYILNNLNINLNNIIIFENNYNEISKAIDLGILSEKFINLNI